MRSLSVLVLALVLGSLAACGRGSSEAPQAADAAAPAAAPSMRLAKEAASGGAPAQAQAEIAARRYMAVRHTLNIVTAPDGVEAAWRQANEACLAAGCEVLNASVQRDDERWPATATLEARVPPDRLEAFLKRVGSLGRVGLNARTAEDKTDAVLDTEARLKNQTAFRDHLRVLMATPGAKLKDLIEVERELVQVQSELDALAAQRKVLANETDKVHVSMSFNARREAIEAGMWQPVRNALLDAGHVVAASLGVLITVLVGALPWAAALLLAAWIARLLWRRRRARA